MKKIVSFFLAFAATCLLVTPAYSAEVTYNPNTQFYDMNSNGVLSLWGVPEAGGNALVANPDCRRTGDFSLITKGIFCFFEPDLFP